MSKRQQLLAILAQADLANADVQRAAQQGARDAASTQAWTGLLGSLVPAAGQAIGGVQGLTEKNAQAQAAQAIANQASSRGGTGYTGGGLYEGVPKAEQNFQQKPEQFAAEKVAGIEALQEPKDQGVFGNFASLLSGEQMAKLRARTTAQEGITKEIAANRAADLAAAKERAKTQYDVTSEKQQHEASAALARELALLRTGSAEKIAAGQQKTALEIAEIKKKANAAASAAVERLKGKKETLLDLQIKNAAANLAKLEAPSEKDVEDLQTLERKSAELDRIIKEKPNFNTGIFADALASVAQLLPGVELTDRNVFRSHVFDLYNEKLKQMSGAAVTPSEETRQKVALLTTSMDDNTFMQIAQDASRLMKIDIENSRKRMTPHGRSSTVAPASTPVSQPSHDDPFADVQR